MNEKNDIYMKIDQLIQQYQRSLNEMDGVHKDMKSMNSHLERIDVELNDAHAALENFNTVMDEKISSLRKLEQIHFDDEIFSRLKETLSVMERVVSEAKSESELRKKEREDLDVKVKKIIKSVKATNQKIQGDLNNKLRDDMDDIKEIFEKLNNMELKINQIEDRLSVIEKSEKA